MMEPRTFDFANLETDQVLLNLGTSLEGLGEDESRKRWLKYGPNEVRARRVMWWHIFFRQLGSPLIYLLVAAAVVVMLLGEIVDGGVILAIVAINSLLGFFQEYRSEQTSQMLKKYTSAKSHVVRDGKTELAESGKIVPGDIVIVEPGDIIAADVRWLKTEGLSVDESVLSGESIEKIKTERTAKNKVAEIFKAENLGFAGTTVTHGQGWGVVVATGGTTVWGQVVRDTVEIDQVSSYEKDIAKFSKFILKIIGVTIVLIMGINVVTKGGSVSWVELALFSIALAVSVIPEALPVVITFGLSRGALRLAKKRVVVKRLAAVEDLGNIEILCTDKTGTLTENKLTADEVFGYEMTEEEVMALAGLTCLPAMTTTTNKDPIDLAIWQRLTVGDRDKLTREAKIVNFVPFDPEGRKIEVKVKWNNKLVSVERGAYETVIGGKPASREEKVWVGQMDKTGKRIIAVSADGRPAGLISLVDPIKQTSVAAVEDAENLGVEIKILTGDSPAVAGAVAKKIGLIKLESQVITGAEMDKLEVAKQHEVVRSYRVFARVTPAQKNKIVDLLQENFRVGFLGEGINDGPALKSADVGLVVDHAADVAREAADIILLKKDLKVIVDGIEEGRKAAINTSKYILATLSSNFGNFYAVSIASLFVNYLPMLPLQILLLNLLSDLPMISIATDNVSRGEVSRPMPFDLKNLLATATVLGIVSTLFDFVFFGVFYRFNPEVLQTSWFVGSVLTELVFLYSIRSRRFFLKGLAPSKAILILTGVAGLVALVLPFTDIGREVFRFTSLAWPQMIMILAIVGVYLTTTESVKLWYLAWKK